MQLAIDRVIVGEGTLEILCDPAARWGIQSTRAEATDRGNVFGWFPSSVSSKQRGLMLYLVATPIGNLRDITLRAIDILGSVDFVASEDTRRTGMLLKHLEIKKPQIAFHEHNEKKAGERIIALLQQGNSVALVTNAGTPVVSDPGYSLVQSAIAAGIQITSIPGPTAFVSAVIVSGLPTHSFLFRGFPPRKSGARRKFLMADEQYVHTLIYYESPYRLMAFLQDAVDVLGDRRSAVVNDLTKFYEAIYRGRISEIMSLLSKSTPKGEYVIVVEGKPNDESDRSVDREEDE